MHVFSHAEGLVQADRGGISHIRLNEDDIGPARFGHPLEFPDEIRGDPFSAMFGRDREVINVEFFARLLEFLEFIGHQPADDRVAIKRNERDEVRLAQEVSQVRFAGHGALVRVQLLKRLAEDPEKGFEEGYIRVGECFVGVLHGCIHNYLNKAFPLFRA